MPVRKIVPTYGSLTGRFLSWKTGPEVLFESGLEKDFVYMLEFDHLVDSYEAQPLTIQFRGQQNKLRRYTPDFLVKYNPVEAKEMKPCLFEIKYQADLKKNWEQLQPKFTAAAEYARQRNWTFKVLTEKEIRVPRLFNSKFLLPYRKYEHEHLMELNVLRQLKKVETSSPKELADILGNGDEYNRGRYLWIIWHLLSVNKIEFFANEKLNMNSEVWINPERR